MKTKKNVFCVVLFVCMLTVSYAHASYWPPLPEALDALESTDTVSVYQQAVWFWINNTYTVFEPRTTVPETGFIFYCGAFVDPLAYAPLMHALADAGYLAMLPSMPNNMPLYGFRRAGALMRRFQNIEQWVIGGHSLGGVMACRFARKRPGTVSGVVLLASYPSSTFSLADTDIEVLSVSGDLDGLSTPDKIEDSRDDLPDDTRFIVITGGNHTQFGWYECPDDLQPGDNPAEITREQRQQETIDALVDFLSGL